MFDLEVSVDRIVSYTHILWVWSDLETISYRVKLLLEFFVGVVDAELLEAVDFEGLETVDVEHPDELVRPGLVTNSILFGWLFKTKDRCKKVRFLQTHNQGLRQLLLTVSWDLCA